MLAFSPHPSPFLPSPLPPLPFDQRDRAPKVARRALVPRCSSAPQQSFVADPSVCVRHVLTDQFSHRVGVVRRPRRCPICELTELLTLDDLLDRLVGGPTELSRSPLTTQLLIRGDDVQLCPLALLCEVRPPISPSLLMLPPSFPLDVPQLLDQLRAASSVSTASTLLHHTGLETRSGYSPRERRHQDRRNRRYAAGPPDKTSSGVPALRQGR